MGVQKRLSRLGFAKQTAKGTPATAPKYVIGLTGGAVYSTDISEDDLDTTWDNRYLQGHDRSSVVPGSAAEVVAMPQSVGALLMAALGAVTETGTAPNITHTFTAATGLPWYSLFGSYGADKVEVHDSKIDSLELSWEKSGAVKVKTKWMGCELAFDSTWTDATATKEQVAGGVVRAGGGTFTVNGAAARVTSGTITIENGLEALTSTAVTPDDIFEAEVKCTVSLTITPDDMTLWRHAVTGSDAGTTISAAPVYGALDLTFAGPSGVSLQFTTNHCKALVAMPDADPAGGAAEVTLEGATADPGDGTDPFQFILTNSVATY